VATELAEYAHVDVTRGRDLVVRRVRGRHRGKDMFISRATTAYDTASVYSAEPPGDAPVVDIQRDPQVMRGLPVFTGTRIPVYIVLDYLADGYSVEELLEDYPDLTTEHVKAALTYASRLLSSGADRVTAF